MTCDCETLWSVCGGCCDGAICKTFPKVDWNRVSWQVTSPGAVDHEVIAASQWRSGLFNWYTWGEETNALTGWVANSSEPAFVGDASGTPNVTFSSQQMLHRAGAWRSEHAGACAWRTYDRELLVPWNLGLLLAEKSFVGSVSGQIFAIGTAAIAGPSGSRDASWWDIFPAMECTYLPGLQARSDISNIVDALPYVPLARLQQIEAALKAGGMEQLAGSKWLVCPTVLDITASWALNPGLLFGLVDDPPSPLHGQVTIWNDATLVPVTGGEVGQQRMTATAWNLVSGSEVKAEFGTVNRFERTNSNDALPAWVELELIQV
jgi:hypothetical protein